MGASTTALEYDPEGISEYLSPESIPQNVPTTGEGSVVIAPFLHEPVCIPDLHEGYYNVY